MIFQVTKEDQKKIQEIEKYYDSKIREVEDLIKELAPEKTLEEFNKEYKIKRLPQRPKPVGKNDDGSPIYDQKELDLWKERSDAITAKLSQSFDAWLASGSQEWRDARKERSRLIAERVDAHRAFAREIEKREFSKLGGDRDRIIQNAKEQVSLMIENRFEKFKSMIETGKRSDGTDLLSFSSRDLRVDGKEVFLDTATIIQECKLSLLSLHYEALAQDQDAIRELDDLVLSIVTDSPRTSSEKGVLGAEYRLKKPRKARSKKELPVFVESIEQDFFMFSTTPPKDLIFSLLSNNGDVVETAREVNAVAKKKRAQVSLGEQSRFIKVETDNAQTVVELMSSACQKFNSKTAKKILHFIESELYLHIYYKGKLNDDVLSFSLQKMVDKKLYTSVQNARRAFYDASNVLTALRLSATTKSGKTQISVNEGNGRVVLFPTMIVEKGQCLIRLNKDINWTPILKDFFFMPDSWWTLPDNASDLEYKIFRMIRLNQHKVDEKGKLVFNISLQTVAEWLDLPLNTKNPKHNVKEPIESAVRQIVESLDPKNFKIAIKTDLNASLSQYLTGYLEITVGGIYTQNLVDLNKKQQSRIESALRRKEKIVNEASVRKLVEQMKEDEKQAQNG